MNGYVRNKSYMWTHAMKRSIRPGEKIPLDTIYAQYGVKHGLAEGEEFVNWLRNIKLKNEDMWEIVFSGDSLDLVDELKEEKPQTIEPKVEENIDPYEGKDEITAKIKDLTVKDVTELSVRKGREVLPRIMDPNLLRYALQQANQLAGKDSLCRMLRKRIQELQIAR